MSEINKLFVKIEQVEGRVIFNLSGALNETFASFVLTLTKQLPKLLFIEFNLSGITLVNSSGIREWANLIEAAQHVEVKLTHCPKVFIDQVNTVEGFLTSNCKIESFYVPYYNEAINLEKNLLLSRTKDYSASEVKIVSTIIEDNITYQIDVIEKTYFRFVKKFA